MVPKGYTLRLWQNKDFGGKHIDIVGQYTDGNQALQCINVKDQDFRRQTSSL